MTGFNEVGHAQSTQSSLPCQQQRHLEMKNHNSQMTVKENERYDK